MSWNTPTGGNSWGAPPSDNTQCDPTFEVCDNAKTTSAPPQDEPAPAQNTTAPATAPAPTPADNTAVANATNSSSAILWGLLSTAQLVNGYLMYDDYNTFSTTLNTGKTGTQSTNWSSTWILTQAPIKYWVNASYATMGMQGASVLAWFLRIIGLKGLFNKLFTLSLLFPLVQIGMSVYAFTQYKTCSATTSANWSGITTGSDVQYVSCATYASESYVPSSVNDDKYQTWLGANAGGATLLMLYSFMKKGGLTASDSDSKDDKSESAAAAPAPAPAPAASPAPASSDDSTAAEEPAAEEPAAAKEEPAASNDNSWASGNSGSANSWGGSSNSNSGFGEPDNTQPANEPEPEPANEPQDWNGGGWNSGWGNL